MGGAFWSLLFYSVLAAISIGGSIGGINSATNTVLSEQARHERELARFDEQIASIEWQIQLNEEAARKYIELERISSGVSSLQHANTKLRLQQDELRQQRDAKPVNDQSSMLGLMSSLADGVGMIISQVQFPLVCFLSVLLDVFGAFFVSLISKENCFRRMWRWQQDQARLEAQEALAMAVQHEPMMPPIPPPKCWRRCAVSSSAASARWRRRCHSRWRRWTGCSTICCHKGYWGRGAIATTTSIQRWSSNPDNEGL